MANSRFLPDTDAGLRDWSANFSAMINLMPAEYGLTPEQGSAYLALNDTYDTALTAALDPATRGGSTIFAKNQAKKALAASARRLARIIQAYPGITDQQRYDLGLTVPKERSPIEPPTEAPTLDVISVSGRTARVRLHAVTVSRGKPTGVAGANLYAFVGETAPVELVQWQFMFNTTRTVMNVSFDADVAPGSRVWLTACWYNPRAQNGPLATPVGTNLPGGGVKSNAMRLAA